MDALSLLLQLVFRSLFVLLPLTVACLALRRALLSRSANAWIYSGICLFSGAAAAGMVPLTLGIGEAVWPLILLALASPVLWVGALLFCDPVEDPLGYYDAVAPDGPEFQSFRLEEAIHCAKAPVLSLDDAPSVPVFRHRSLAANGRKADKGSGKSLVAVAKSMRGNDTSDNRRPLMLPPPEHPGIDLPFLCRR